MKISVQFMWLLHLIPSVLYESADVLIIRIWTVIVNIPFLTFKQPARRERKAGWKQPAYWYSPYQLWQRFSQSSWLPF